MRAVREPWKDIALQPGDIVLTGSSSLISTAIQFATGSDVSHVMLAVDRDTVIEATEYRNLAADRSGGIYLRSLQSALDGEELDRIIVRRPLQVQHGDVIAAAERFLREQPVYSSSGMMLTVLLVGLADGWPERVAEVVLSDSGEDEVEAYLAEVVADGPARMVCAELVYRVLHEAHVPLAHDELLLGDAVKSVRAMDPPRDYGHAAELAHPRDRLAAALDFANRQPELPDIERAVERLGWQRYIRLVSRQVRRAYEQRRLEPDNGDIADLVCPSDFVEMRPFRTLDSFSRSGNQWLRAGQIPSR